MRSFWLTVILVAASWQTTLGEEWGNLKGVLKFEGDAPTAARLNVNKDTEVCGKDELFNESLVVNKENNGLANAVIYLYLGRGDEVNVHPDFESTANDKISFDNAGCRFEPHVVAIRTSQTLVIGNKDAVGHNTKIDSSEQGINPVIPANGSLEHQFKFAERRPVPVGCNIHPWMKGWLVVKEDPYFAVTDEDGAFEIKNLPTGKWEFQLWQEKAGYLKKLSTEFGETSKKGRIEIEIKAGDNDLGTVSVPSELFEK